MARSPRRITRKDIRRADQFVTLTGEVFHYVSLHKRVFIALASLVLLALVALWGWDAYKGRQNRLAGLEYSRALNFYRAARYSEAIGLFDHVKTYGTSPYSRLALLYEANSHIALDDPKKAEAALSELLRRETGGTLIRQIGLMSLGHLQESAGRCKEAVSGFAAAAKIQAPFRNEALLGKARCAAETGDLNEALLSYREYLTSYPASEKAGELSLRVKEIEAQMGAKGGK